MEHIVTNDYEGPDRRQPRFQRLVDQAIDNGIVLGAIALTLFTILAVLSYAIIVTNRNAQLSNEKIRKGIQCISLEDIEYRQSSVDFRKRAAKALGFDPGPDPFGLPPVSSEKVSEVCGNFFTDDEIKEFFGPFPEDPDD